MSESTTGAAAGGAILSAAEVATIAQRAARVVAYCSQPHVSVALQNLVEAKGLVESDLPALCASHAALTARLAAAEQERDAAVGTLTELRQIGASVAQWRDDFARVGMYGDERKDQHLVGGAATTVVAMLTALERCPEPPDGR